MKLPLKNQQPHPYNQRFVIEARDPQTGGLLFASRPEDAAKLPKGEPSVEATTPQKIADMYYEMNPQDTGPSAGWETICQYFDSINWYWRPKTW